MVEPITGLTFALTTMNRLKQTNTTTTTNVSNKETLLENQNSSDAHLRIQLENENCYIVHMRTQPRTDDEVSWNASNLWFGNKC